MEKQVKYSFDLKGGIVHNTVKSVSFEVRTLLTVDFKLATE